MTDDARLHVLSRAMLLGNTITVINCVRLWTRYSGINVREAYSVLLQRFHHVQAVDDSFSLRG
jgi:hypothetical protein